MSLVSYILKKGGMKIVANEKNELILTRATIEWGASTYSRKLKEMETSNRLRQRQAICRIGGGV